MHVRLNSERRRQSVAFNHLATLRLYVLSGGIYVFGFTTRKHHLYNFKLAVVGICLILIATLLKIV